MQRFTKSVITAVSALAFAVVASASPITGTIFQKVPDAKNAGDLANQSTSLPNATFTVGPLGIDFNSNATGYTPTTFLNGVSFTSPANGFDPNGTFNNTAIKFTGQIYLASGDNMFTIRHDDGVDLSIGGTLVVNVDGPTSAENTPFTVNEASAGYQSFKLDYAECCGSPAVLQWKFDDQNVGEVPEPNSGILLGSGALLLLLGLGYTRRHSLVTLS